MVKQVKLSFMVSNAENLEILNHIWIDDKVLKYLIIIH